jgi:protein gp37
MGEHSKIEWTHHTFNPWIGCQHVSPGCDHCYAEAQNAYRKWSADGAWGPHAARRKTSPANWRNPIRWNAAALKARVRHGVFCASLADWLDNRVPRAWRSELAALIKITPMLDWLLLTKRPENFRKLVPTWAEFGCPWNVWFGVTAEDREHYERRWPILRNTPARVRFISYEPALGPLSMFPFPHDRKLPLTPDWIICGGESGSKAREMDPQWARDLRDECACIGVAFFFKQMTRKQPIPDDLMVRQFPDREGARQTMLSY